MAVDDRVMVDLRACRQSTFFRVRQFPAATIQCESCDQLVRIIVNDYRAVQASLLSTLGSCYRTSKTNRTNHTDMSLRDSADNRRSHRREFHETESAIMPIVAPQVVPRLAAWHWQSA